MTEMSDLCYFAKTSNKTELIKIRNTEISYKFKNITETALQKKCSFSVMSVYLFFMQ